MLRFVAAVGLWDGHVRPGAEAGLASIEAASTVLRVPVSPQREERLRWWWHRKHTLRVRTT